MEWTLGGSTAINNQYIIVGLSYTNPDNQATSIKYGWYTHANGLTITESGVPPAGQTYGTFGAYVPGDVLRIARDNGLILYYLNGDVKYSRVDPQPNNSMVVDFSFYEYNRSIYDLKIVKNSPGIMYLADVVSYSDYSPYGTLLDGRHGNDDTYRYGFQGQERDDEIKGAGNSYNYEYRMHDPRIGRFFAIDPLASKYPFYSPYAFSGNRVIDSRELEGKEPISATEFKKSDNYLVIVVLGYEGSDPPVNKTQHKNNPYATYDGEDGLNNVTKVSNYASDIYSVCFSGSDNDVTPNDMKTTIKNFKSVNPKGQIILVGHSIGAQNIIEFAEKNQDITVDLMITVDNADILGNVDDDDVYGNVKNSINYYDKGGIGEESDYQSPSTNGVNVWVEGTSHTEIDNLMQTTIRQDIYNFRNGDDAPKIAKARTKIITKPSVDTTQ